MKRIILIVLVAVSFMVSCNGSSSSQSGDYNKTPVFFVHGHGMNADSWNAMITYLQSGAYPELYLRAVHLKPNNGANIPAAERQIAPAVEWFLDDVNDYLEEKLPEIPLKTKVDIVSHSMGSVSSRWYAAKLRPDRVRKWISLAGANHGTNYLCPCDSDGARDLCPAFATTEQESRVQYLLNGLPGPDCDETPYGLGKDSAGVTVVHADCRRQILYITVRTSPDQWITPEDSPIIDGSGGIIVRFPDSIRARETSPGNILMTNRVGHAQMLSDPETMQLVRLILGLSDTDFGFGKRPHLPDK